MPPRSIEVGIHDTAAVRLSPKMRRTHLHIIGPSESGKTRAMEHMIKQDIKAGHGVCVLDPTGNLYTRLAQWCVARGMHRRRKLHFFDPNQDDWLPAYNPLLLQPNEEIAKRVDSMVLACARVWSEDSASTPLLKRCLRVVFTALIEHNMTLVEAVELVQPPTTAEEFRRREYLTGMLRNPYAKRVWQRFNKMKDERFEEVFSSTNNRLADFLMSERMSRIFGCGAGSLDLRQCMDNDEVLIMNLQTEKISKDNSRLLGTLITNELLQLARSRDNDLAAEHPFYCYIDEAYKYLTEDIEEAIDETRQKGLHYILAHQRISQLHDAGTSIYGGVMSIRNKLIFGDLEPDDTHELAADFYQADYDENEEIDLLRKPITVRHEIRKNRQHRKGVGRVQTEVDTAVESRSSMQSDNAMLSLPVDAVGLPTTGDFVDGGGIGFGAGHAKARGKALGSATSDNETDGWAESAWPVMEERAGALRSFDEQMHIFAKQLKTIPSFHAVLKIKGQSPQQLQMPYVGDPVAKQNRLPDFFKEAATRSLYIHSVDELHRQLAARRARLNGLANEVIEPEEPSTYYDK